MAPAPVDPSGWQPPSFSFLEWAAGAAWTVTVAVIAAMATFVGIIARIFLGMGKRISALEVRAGQVDHDVRGMRQNQIAAEALAASRHADNQRREDQTRRENKDDHADTRKFLAELIAPISQQLTEARQRIDRLLERGD